MTGIANPANPVIRNVGLVSRESQLAIPIGFVVDGATISADGTLLRGTLMVYNSANGKWHSYVHGTDTLVAGEVLLCQDDTKLLSGVDAFASGYREGFFDVASILDANSSGAMVFADLTSAAGFVALPKGPGMSQATEVRLKP